MIETRVHLPTPPGEERTRHLGALLEVVTEANAEWFADHPQAPCCLAGARPRITYKEPSRNQPSQAIYSAPQVLQRRRATCADAAAYDAGAARARGRNAWIELEPQSANDYHVVAYIEGQRVDSSALLRDGICQCQ
jgi:hypothetical protein